MPNCHLRGRPDVRIRESLARSCAVLLLLAAESAPRPTYARRSNRSSAFARATSTPHRRCSAANMMALKSSSSQPGRTRPRRTDAWSAIWLISQSTSGDASLHVPNTTLRTSPKLRSFVSTGPSWPSVVCNHRRSSARALSRYSALTAAARRVTAQHLKLEGGYVLLLACSVFTSTRVSRVGPCLSGLHCAMRSGTRPCRFREVWAPISSWAACGCLRLGARDF